MKKLLILLSLLLFSITGNAQISFEKGYYITNDNQKITGLIKDLDWKNNPTEIEFKLSENATSQIIKIENASEFSVEGISKYVRTNVNIDQSSDDINHLSNKKEPDFKNENQFLKVLVEGKTSLFFYEKGNQRRYFFNPNEGQIEPLIYKRYRNYQENAKHILINNKYRQQLYIHLRCSNIDQRQFENLKYSKDDLINLFVKYNNCQNTDITNYNSKEVRKVFNLNIRPGLNSTSYILRNTFSTNYNVDYGTKLSLRIGAEAEFILPFNKDKWAILVEPTFQSFSAIEESEAMSYSSEVNYKSIELPAGIRHYFFLNEKNQVFTNVLFVYDFPFKSDITFSPGPTLNINSKENFVFGLGFKHNNNLSIELQYRTKRSITKLYPDWPSEYKALSIVLGYNMLR
ncbi:tRNA modification GTPase [uncultured Arcticibacterium sp.]|uniref:tRNA modification GTPase n=1 Tax=uncultured Arcticibacterium sp. TaxID=2173042 RepID=UPI0030FB9B39